MIENLKVDIETAKGSQALATAWHAFPLSANSNTDNFDRQAMSRTERTIRNEPAASHLPHLSITSRDHHVKQGETLSSIAEHHLPTGASTAHIYEYVDEIARRNHIKNANKIDIGQVITFPPIKQQFANPSSGSKENSSRTSSTAPTLATDAATEHKSSKVSPSSPADAKPTLEQQRDPAIPVPAGLPISPNPSTKSAEAAAPKPQEVAAPSAPKVPDAPSKPSESSFMRFVHGSENVLGDIAAGCVDEVVNHGAELLKDAAVGAVVAVGTAMLSPALTIAAAAVGTAAGVYEVAEHGGEWLHAGMVVANPDNYSSEEQKQAHQELHGIGQGVSEFAAGIVGGAIGAIGVKLGGRLLAKEAARAVNAGKTSETSSIIDTSSKAEVVTKVEPSPKVKDAPISLSQHPVEGVTVESPANNVRIYKVDGKEFRLEEGGNWYYGKRSGHLGDAGSVKIHVNVTGGKDLARVQKVLIPYLNKPEVNELTAGWKTFDPEYGFKDTKPGGFTPGPKGENAKGFTIYARSKVQIDKLKVIIDKELTDNELTLTDPPVTGNVDTLYGTSNRVGTVRDFFPKTFDGEKYGVKIDKELTEKIEAAFGPGGCLTNDELEAVEEVIGLHKDILSYDEDGNLMLRVDGNPNAVNGNISLGENYAISDPGYMTYRPAMYALSRFFGWDPADGVI